MATRRTRRREARALQRLPQFLKDRLVAKLILAAVVLMLASLVPVFEYGPPWAVKTSAPRLRTVIIIDERKTVTSDKVRTRLCKPWTICRNGKDGVDVVVLKSGDMPRYPTTGVVETDDNCAPDIYGVSHCRNRLRLANGHVIEIQHNHNMQIDPCLGPGETVEVEPEHPAIASTH